MNLCPKCGAETERVVCTPGEIVPSERLQKVAFEVALGNPVVEFVIERCSVCNWRKTISIKHKDGTVVTP